MSDTDKQPDFEKQLAELENLVAELERGELSLEQSLIAYERGMKLANQCQDALSAAEKRIAIISGVDPETGELISTPYESPKV